MSEIQPPGSTEVEKSQSLVTKDVLLGGFSDAIWMLFAVGGFMIATYYFVAHFWDEDVYQIPRRQYLVTLFCIGVAYFVAIAVPRIVSYFVPRRIEIKPDKLCIYHRTSFKYLNLSEISLVRRVNFFESIFCLRSKHALVLLGPGRKKTIIQTDLFKEPDQARRALRDWLLPVLQKDSATPPQANWILPAYWPFFFLSLVVVFQIVGLFLVRQSPSSVFVMSSLASLVIIAFKVIRRKIQPDGIQSKSITKSTFIPFDQVKTIDLKLNETREVLTLRDERGSYLCSFNTDQPNYPRIRDYILLNCPHAHHTDPPDPRDLELCALTVPLTELHKPSASEPLSTANIETETDTATHHLTLGDSS